MIPNPTSLETTFQIPSDAQPGHTIHVIFEATDSDAVVDALPARRRDDSELLQGHAGKVSRVTPSSR